MLRRIQRHLHLGGLIAKQNPWNLCSRRPISEVPLCVAFGIWTFKFVLFLLATAKTILKIADESLIDDWNKQYPKAALGRFPWCISFRNRLESSDVISHLKNKPAFYQSNIQILILSNSNPLDWIQEATFPTILHTWKDRICIGDTVLSVNGVADKDKATSNFKSSLLWYLVCQVWKAATSKSCLGSLSLFESSPSRKLIPFRQSKR